MQSYSQSTQAALRRDAPPQIAELDVATIGYLVPRSRAPWRVHSVFANACNFSCGDGLLTLVAPRAGHGPTLLALRAHPARRLDSLFAAGEVVSWRATTRCTRRALLRFDAADVWSPAPPRAQLMAADIAANLALAARPLALHRQRRPNQIDHECRPVFDALTRATRALDGGAALRAVEQLVGLGQGLTPAGDDFLVGWLAALDALANDPAQRMFVDLLGAAARRLATRTTPIAAHYLRLAAAGHYLEVLVCLRDALLCESDRDRLRHAVDAALDLGATSGADMLGGLLHAIGAWRAGAIVIE